MPKKFDTNPLDPDFPNRVKEAQTETLPNPNAQTRRFAQTADTEEQTRRFDEANFSSYSSPYDASQVPNVYQTANLKSDVESSSSRKVAKIGLPENVLIALPYLPYVGLIAGLIELLLVPKSETKVRFHAAQGLAAHLAIWIITTVLGGIGHIPILGLADTANWIFQVATTVMLLIFALKAWKGKPVHIESVDTLTEWLEEKIKTQS